MNGAATAKDYALDTRLLKVEAVAHELQVSRTVAFGLIKSGEIESVTIGASRRVPREALDSYIEKLRTSS